MHHFQGRIRQGALRLIDALQGRCDVYPMLRPFILFALLAPTLAHAAERRRPVTSFDRLRISGPFDVTYAPGSPSARVSGDPRITERVEVRVDGSTLTLRMGSAGWGERREAGPSAPIKVTLSSPMLTSASVLGGGRLSIGRVKGAKLDLAIGGSGQIAAADTHVDQLFALLTGTGTMTLSGRAGKARLTTDGSGRIDAAAMQADELMVLVNGTGETRAAARYSANLTNAGLGTITVAGSPKCTVRAPAGGVVQCGN